jgi:hypothetical protein
MPMTAFSKVEKRSSVVDTQRIEQFYKMLEPRGQRRRKSEDEQWASRYYSKRKLLTVFKAWSSSVDQNEQHLKFMAKMAGFDISLEQLYGAGGRAIAVCFKQWQTFTHSRKRMRESGQLLEQFIAERRERDEILIEYTLARRASQERLLAAPEVHGWDQEM